MKLLVAYEPTVSGSTSPYRVRDSQGRDLHWATAFLDGQRLRQLSPRSLRIYAYDLLDFARWFEPRHLPLAEMTESTLVDYVRHQLDRDPQPAPQTVNHRLGTVRCCYRFHTGSEIPNGHVHFPRRCLKRSPLGYGRLRPALARGLRLKQDRRVIVPLTAEAVAKFWQSFRTFRDLALVGLMLLDGLRSCEVLALELEDVHLADGQVRVHGKGRKKRLLPVPAELLDVLGQYLHLERPLANTPAVFVCLKGHSRGQPMTVAGLRSLFRHHRLRSRIPDANPHRLRHTFGADMVRAGMSLPALQHLMGHSQIHTTMLYVQLAPQDVWREYARAIEKRKALDASQVA